MPKIVNIHAAKTHLSSLLALVAQGEEVIIAKAGKPVARLARLDPIERPLGFVQASIDEAFFEPLPEHELAAWGEIGP